MLRPEGQKNPLHFHQALLTHLTLLFSGYALGVLNVFNLRKSLGISDLGDFQSCSLSVVPPWEAEGRKAMKQKKSKTKVGGRKTGEEGSREECLISLVSPRQKLEEATRPGQDRGRLGSSYQVLLLTSFYPHHL